MEFKDRLKEGRKLKWLTKEELSKLMNIKQQQYSKYESGINYMGVSTFIKICECLNISPDYILGFTNEIKPLDKNKRN